MSRIGKVRRGISIITAAVLAVQMSLPVMAAEGDVSVRERHRGFIAAPADHNVVSFTDDPDYDPGTAVIGGDSEQAVYLSEVGESSYYPASYQDSSSVLSGLKKSMPSPRDQGDYGFCWCFGTIAAVEGNLINQQGMSPSGVDLSELHLGYYTCHYSLDNGNGKSDTFTNQEYNQEGGEGLHPYIALGALSNRTGAVKESVMPYSGAGDTKRGRVAAKQDLCDYSVTGWQMYDLSNENDWPYIKAAIRANGAMIFDICWGDNDSSYNQSYNSFYSRETQADHTVSVVGWDDTFPKSNFGRNSNIKGDGAWIIRNSWTTTPEMSDNAYFYVSYYNACNYGANGDGHAAYAISAVDSSKDYKNIYQYDGAIASWGEAETQSSEQQGANVFTARGDEEIKAVSFQTGTDTVNADYEVKVYTGLSSGTSDPTSGTLASTTSGKTSASGLYRVTLGQPVAVGKDSVFSVVVTLKKSSGNPSFATESMKSEYDLDGVTQNTAISRGQSFIRGGSSGTWKDLVDDSNCGNVRIKAFSDDDEGDHAVDGVSLPETREVAVGSTITLSPTFTPSNATNRNVTWRSENDAVAKVSNTGVVTGVSEGSVKIYVKTEDGGHEASCTVTVKYKAVDDVSLPETAKVTLGKTITLIPTFTPSDASNRNVTWRSENDSVAKVSDTGVVTGISEGSAKIFVKTEDGGHEASCTVTVSEKGDEPDYQAVTGVSLPETAKVTVGNTVTLTPTFTPSDATNRNVTWRSENESIATVSTSGAVTGISEGSAKIFVKTEDGGHEASCTVTVSKKGEDPVDPVDPSTDDVIVLTPDSFNQNVTMIPGETRRFSVSSTGELIYGVRWKVEDGGTKGCVSVKNGVVTAKKPGSALITATYGTSNPVKFNVTVEGQPSLTGQGKSGVSAPKSVTMKTNDSGKTITLGVPLDKDISDFEIKDESICSLDEDSASWNSSETKLSVRLIPKKAGATWIVWTFCDYTGEDDYDDYWGYGEALDAGLRGGKRRAYGYSSGEYQLCTKVVVSNSQQAELNVKESTFNLSVGEGKRIRVTTAKDSTDSRLPSFSASGKGIKVSKSGFVVGLTPGASGSVTVKLGNQVKTVQVNVKSFSGEYLTAGKISTNAQIPKASASKPKIVKMKLKKVKGTQPELNWSILGSPKGLTIDKATGEVSVTSGAQPGCYTVVGNPAGNQYNAVYSELILK